MTAREAARRYGAIDERAAVGFATTLLHHWLGHDPEALASRLRLNEKALATTVKKYGLNINGVILLISLSLLPELPLLRRVLFLAIVVVMAITVVKFHEKAIPNAAIYLSTRVPGVLERAWPQIISWLVAVTSGLVAAIAYGLLKGELNWIGL